MRHLIIAPIVLAVAGFAAPAQAAITLKIDGFLVGSTTGSGAANSLSNQANSRQMQWQVNALGTQPALLGGALTVDQAGQFGGTIDFGLGGGSQSFAGYCVELTQGVVPFPSTTGVVYTAQAADAYFASSTIANNIGKLYSEGIVFDTVQKTAAFQIAVWELIYEKSGTFAVGDASLAGNADFRTYTSTWSANASTLALAQSYLDAVPSTTNRANLTVYKNDMEQDFIVATMIPEPSTYVMMLAGIAGIGLFGAKRSRKAD